MAFYKVIFQFKHQVFSAGWSELYYFQGNSISSAVARSKILAALRGKLLGANCFMTGIRISRDDVQGEIAKVPNPVYNLLDPTQLADTPWQTALCRVSAQNLYFANLYLRGIPDSIFNPETVADKTFALLWFSTLDALKPELMKQAWFLKVTNKDTATFPKQRITNILPGAAQEFVISYALTAPFAPDPGHKVRIYNCREFPTLQGAWPVKSVVSGTSVTINYAPGTASVFPYRGRSTMKVIDTTYESISGFDFDRITKHNVGRVFGQPVGRRKRRPVVSR